MQYVIIQKKKSLKISKMVNSISLYTTYHSCSSVFMTNNLPSGAKKALQNYQTRKSLNGQSVFLLYLSSSTSDRLNCVTLLRWFSQETAAFYTKQCTQRGGGGEDNSLVPRPSMPPVFDCLQYA